MYSKNYSLAKFECYICNNIFHLPMQPTNQPTKKNMAKIDFMAKTWLKFHSQEQKKTHTRTVKINLKTKQRLQVVSL